MILLKHSEECFITFASEFLRLCKEQEGLDITFEASIRCSRGKQAKTSMQARTPFKRNRPDFIIREKGADPKFIFVKYDNQKRITRQQKKYITANIDQIDEENIDLHVIDLTNNMMNDLGDFLSAALPGHDQINLYMNHFETAIDAVAPRILVEQECIYDSRIQPKIKTVQHMHRRILTLKRELVLLTRHSYYRSRLPVLLKPDLSQKSVSVQKRMRGARLSG